MNKCEFCKIFLPRSEKEKHSANAVFSLSVYADFSVKGTVLLVVCHGEIDAKTVACNACLHALDLLVGVIDRSGHVGGGAVFVRLEKFVKSKDLVNKAFVCACVDLFEKIVIGKLGKFYENVCLLDQSFFKEDDMSVGKYLETEGKRLGGEIKVVDFVLYEKGEGLEKREDNFAEEIAKLTGNN